MPHHLHPSFQATSSSFLLLLQPPTHGHHFYSTSQSPKLKTPMDQSSPPTTPTSNSPPPPSAATAAAPAPITVPKAFKYPEMYMSPTDSIMSPVSKGILARTRSKKKSSLPLPNSSITKEQHKNGDSKFGDMGALEF